MSNSQNNQYTADGYSTYRYAAQKKKRIPIIEIAMVLLIIIFGFIAVMMVLPRSTASEIEDSNQQDETTPSTTEETAASSQNAYRADEVPWNLILVNGNNPLPEDFIVPMFTELRNGHSIDTRAYPELQRMMDDARAEGLDPLIISSYRTWEKQEQLYENKVQEYLDNGMTQEEAEHMAAFWVARPGTSEHQIGLAVDIVDNNFRHLDERQESTDVQKWLIAHCAEYGYILRYPTNKSEITGVGYEPWHYRYVGAEAAKEIMERGICLEEYLDSVLICSSLCFVPVVLCCQNRSRK